MLRGYLQRAIADGASDLFILAGLPLSYKIGGMIVPRSETPLGAGDAAELIRELYELGGRNMSHYEEHGDDDFSVSVSGLSRFRVSAYRQRGSAAAVIRVVRFDIPDCRAIGIPEGVMAITGRTRGMVLVTGPAGGGKSTTLACVIDRINQQRNAHIITLEDPIEYLHRNKKGVISQRELGTDTESYLTGLRACLRQAPDVILVGEMRDHEAIRTAMTAAETGHLVISTLHTTGAVSTIDRVIDVFPANQQQQVKIQLSMLLQTVVSQQLLPTVEGGMVPAFEIMNVNSAIRTMIRESKVHQIDTVIQSSASEGMRSMDDSIFALLREGRITTETAARFALNPGQMERKISTKG